MILTSPSTNHVIRPFCFSNALPQPRTNHGSIKGLGKGKGRRFEEDVQRDGLERILQDEEI